MLTYGGLGNKEMSIALLYKMQWFIIYMKRLINDNHTDCGDSE